MTRARLSYRCPICNAVEPAASLKVVSGEVEVTCSSCGASLRIPPYDAAAAPPLTPAPPKAAAVDRSLLEVLDHLATLPEELAGQYRRVVEAGDRVEDHRRLLQTAIAAGTMEQLGLIYRYRLERRADDSVALDMREKLLAAAITALAPRADAEQPQQVVKRWTTLGAAAFFILSMILAVSVALRQGCLSP